MHHVTSCLCSSDSCCRRACDGSSCGPAKFGQSSWGRETYYGDWTQILNYFRNLPIFCTLSDFVRLCSTLADLFRLYAKCCPNKSQINVRDCFTPKVTVTGPPVAPLTLPTIFLECLCVGRFTEAVYHDNWVRKGHLGCAHQRGSSLRSASTFSDNVAKCSGVHHNCILHAECAGLCMQGTALLLKHFKLKRFG